ncbi:MAG: LytTR family transcriptional regulator DNA-binding domain-containing protein [Cyclobacteriaceae bacterium]
MSWQLPVGKFIRVHRSFVVAKDKIDKAERHQVTIGGSVVPVSDAYGKELAEALSG